MKDDEKPSLLEEKPPLADRVWLAYWALPRVRLGMPPKFHRLENDFRLSNGMIAKIVHGKRTSIEPPTCEKLAEALTPVWPGEDRDSQVVRDRVAAMYRWLDEGKGAPPKPSGFVPERDTGSILHADKTSETPTLKIAVSDRVQKSVQSAVEQALYESPAEAQAQEVLARAMLLVSARSATK